MLKQKWKKTLSVYHWNLVLKYWVNKTEQIQALVNDIYPDYECISEANLWKSDSVHLCKIDGYNMVKPMGFSRIILLAKHGEQFQLLPNLMVGEIASI